MLTSYQPLGGVSPPRIWFFSWILISDHLSFYQHSHSRQLVSIGVTEWQTAGNSIGFAIAQETII